MSSTGGLIEPALLRRLEHLNLSTKRRFSSTQTGDRRSDRRGLSIEFSDYREYQPGDDLRYVDWKAYGRLEKLFLKLFLDEEDLNVHLLIDSSSSMGFGSPMSKRAYAQRAAAAIGFVALYKNNRVDAAAFTTGIAGRVLPMRGEQSIPVFLRQLAKMPEPGGETAFSQVVAQYAATAPPAGLVVIFSDFFDPSIPTALAALVARRHQMVLVQVLDRAEVDPQITGDLSLVDSETGQTHEVALSDYEIEQYLVRLSQYTEELTMTARKFGMDFIRVVSDEPVENLVLMSLRSAGIVVG